jgi:hypothetical protein
MVVRMGVSSNPEISPGSEQTAPFHGAVKMPRRECFMTACNILREFSAW